MTNRSKAKSLHLLFALALLLGTLISVPPAYAFEYSTTKAILDAGSVVNAKMKSLASGTECGFWTKTNDIKGIRMTDSLPDGFIPSDANTVSISDSPCPIYIFFDSDDGIMYFYSDSDTVVMNPYSGYMFAYNTCLEDISGIASWDSSNVTNICSLFCDVRNLPDALALRNWDTSNITDMSYLFSNAISLKFVDVSNWDTSKVTTMVCMFQVGESHKGNGQLIEIKGLGDLNVSNVTDMTCMFYGAGQMTYYDIARWDVSKVESMNHMFCDNFKLRSLDLSNWDVSCIKTMYCMFDDNYKLEAIGDVSHWNTISLIDAGGWLNYANSFVGSNDGILDLSGWDTHNLKAIGEMFLNTKIHTIDLSSWTFDSITNEKWEGTGHGIYYETGNSSMDRKGFGQMFKDTKNLTTVYVSQSGLDSFNTAVEREVNTMDMWTNSKCKGFTIK